MTADLSALIARLEAAEAGSRELDEAISDALCDHKFRTFVYGLPNDVGMWMYEFEGHSASSALRVTTSLDAALALAERVLPGWYWRAGRTPLGHWHHGRYTYGWAHVSRTDASNCDRGDEATGWAATPALALCIATLRSKLDGYEAEGEVNKNPKAQEG